jgi:hypothetical protein
LRLDFNSAVIYLVSLSVSRSQLTGKSSKQWNYSGAVASNQAMRLETEFRLCLQRQSLEWMWQRSSDVVDLQQPIEPSTWVKLLHSPSAYSSDEALLLCQCGDGQWLAWIPDYGETVLHYEQFFPLS